MHTTGSFTYSRFNLVLYHFAPGLRNSLVAKKLANGPFPNHFEVAKGSIPPKEKPRIEELFVSPEIEWDSPRGRKRRANAVFSLLSIRLPKRWGQQSSLCRRQHLLIDQEKKKSGYWRSYRTSRINGQLQVTTVYGTNNRFLFAWAYLWRFPLTVADVSMVVWSPTCAFAFPIVGTLEWHSPRVSPSATPRLFYTGVGWLQFF